MEKQFITVSPETGETLATYNIHSSEEIAAALRRSREEFTAWRRTSWAERATVLKKVGEILVRDKAALAELMRAEMGKPLAEGTAEVEKCASCAAYYLSEGAGLLEPSAVRTEAAKSYVCLEPLGPVLAIMPWNFPLWQVIRCAIPAIAAGNTVLLKHAANVSGCALALEKIFLEASGREGLFINLFLHGPDATRLIARPEVAAVSLTGSTEVGRLVAAAAGKALKKCVLELGGSDAYLVLKDADLESAARICAQSRLINSGQSCIAAKRFVVESAVLPAFTGLFVKELQSRTIGPMARRDLRESLHAQVKKSVSEGADILCGGEIPPGPGFHYPATALLGVCPGNTAFEQELFGPVAAIVEARDEHDAIRLANLTAFGLGAAVFTRDSAKAERIARLELDAGSCFANALVRSDPRLPFGGIKDSGFGRELSGYGLREFTNIKTVYIA